MVDQLDIGHPSTWVDQIPDEISVYLAEHGGDDSESASYQELHSHGPVNMRLTTGLMAASVSASLPDTSLLLFPFVIN